MMYNDGTQDYDATMEMKRFCYQQLLISERVYQNYVLMHGHDDHAVRLRAAVSHYTRNLCTLDERLQIERAARINNRTVAEQMAAEKAVKKVGI